MNLSALKTQTIYVVIFALFFNAITTTGAFGSANSGSQSVLLCTSQGYKWVEIESDSPTSKQASQHCKLCLFPPSDDSLNDGVTGQTANRFPLLDNQKIHFAARPHLQSQWPYRIAQSRAPPKVIS